jgi:hypothetical protein
MGRPKGSKNKSKKSIFDVLDNEYKEQVEAMDDVQLVREIARVSEQEQSNLRAKKEDQDLANLQWQVREASLPYKEATTANKARIAYALHMRELKGLSPLG